MTSVLNNDMGWHFSSISWLGACQTGHVRGRIPAVSGLDGQWRAGFGVHTHATIQIILSDVPHSCFTVELNGIGIPIINR